MVLLVGWCIISLLSQPAASLIAVLAFLITIPTSAFDRLFTQNFTCSHKPTHVSLVRHPVPETQHLLAHLKAHG